MRKPILTYRQRMIRPGRMKKKKLLSSQMYQEGSSSIAQNADSRDAFPDTSNRKKGTFKVISGKKPQSTELCVSRTIQHVFYLILKL